MKKVLISLIFIFPLFVHAEGNLYINNGINSACLGINFNDSGFGWNSDFDFECTQYENTSLVSEGFEHESILLFDQSFIYNADIFDSEFNSVGGVAIYNSSGEINQSNIGPLSDGVYYASIGTGITNVYFTFYIFEGKFYLDQNDFPNNELILNQLLPQFIIVGLIVILIMFQIFNFKNPWKY